MKIFIDFLPINVNRLKIINRAEVENKIIFANVLLKIRYDLLYYLNILNFYNKLIIQFYY